MLRVSSSSVLIVTPAFGECLIGVRGAEDSLRFLEGRGMASSMSVGESKASSRLGGETLEEKRDEVARVLRRGDGAIILEVSCEMREVRMVLSWWRTGPS